MADPFPARPAGGDAPAALSDGHDPVKQGQQTSRQRQWLEANRDVFDKLIALFRDRSREENRKLIAYSKQWPTLAEGVFYRLDELSRQAASSPKEQAKMRTMLRTLKNVWLHPPPPGPLRNSHVPPSSVLICGAADAPSFCSVHQILAALPLQVHEEFKRYRALAEVNKPISICWMDIWFEFSLDSHPEIRKCAGRGLGGAGGAEPRVHAGSLL